MAVWALLSISQTVKAADVTVYFQCPSDWRTPVCAYAYNSETDRNSGWDDAPAGSEYYTSTGVKLWKCTFDSKYKNVIFKEPFQQGVTSKQYPDSQGFEVKDSYVYTNSGTTGTSLSEFVKNSAFTYRLRGGYDTGEWSNESANFEFVGDGKYTYTFTAAQTGQFRFRVNTSYGSGAALCPNVDATTKSKELTSTPDDVAYTDPANTSASSINNNYWTCNVTAGKKYTFTLSEDYLQATDGGYYHSRKLSVVEEETPITKVIKLLNGTTEVTGSNGKYTLNLSGETSTNATITLTIDGTTYGLADAQTISAAGTTNVDFVANATAALTLTKGLIYSLSVTEDGKMTVVAKEKGVADGNYYLVGNFFTEDGDNINYDKKYFRFINNKGDGTLYFDIPATLSVKAQVYASDGTCYGPDKDGNISNTNPTASVGSVDGKLAAGNNFYWNFSDRGLTETGIYTITITVDAAGVPTAWKVTYDKSKRMAYFLVDPKEDVDAVVQPCYAVKKNDGGCDNKFFGNIYLEKGHHCFVVGNIMRSSDDNIAGHPRRTTSKLYMQGNGGLDPTTKVPDSERSKYTKVYPNKAVGFTYNETMSVVLEYNPTQGDDTYLTNNPDCQGIGGEILKASTQITDYDDPITSIQIVGNGVVDSWELGKAQDMKYNKTLDCWEYTFRTEKAESADNKFRFIANKGWKYNWGEESTEPADQARIPYKSSKEGHEASLKDPNQLGFTKDGKAGSETNRNGAGTYGDMIFNRPAGNWTIRFYIRTISEDGGNKYEAVYAYTITGSESNDIYLTYRNGQFIRTYSNSKPMNPDNDNVKIYEVYKYVKPKEGKVDDIYAKGKVYLRRLNYVPANVGVVLIGEVPAEDGPFDEGQKVAFSLLERTEESVEPGGDYRDVWTKATEYKNANDQWNNYLVPTVTAVDDLGNAKVESGKVIYRYFGLGNYYRTNYHTSLGNADTQADYIGFFRLTANGKSGANKAYLSIPTNAEVGDGVGAIYGYIDYNGQLMDQNIYDDQKDEVKKEPTSLAKMALVFDDLVDGNEATGIKELETENLNNNKYYNLQGIEVAYPVKGIYIHNGKKVIVK